MPTDAAPDDTPPLPGAAAIGALLLGKYRIVRCIAEGGMGLVYEALHLQLQERVAIKVLRPDVAQSRDGREFAARFLREARATIKIRSEHVVRVLDVATLEDGVPCIVMEHLDGLDLERRIAQEGAIPPQEAVDHILQACEALAEAHVLGIIHRDLKPANLFLVRRADGTPSIKVLDFGISKLIGSGNVRLTGKHDVMGSPRYMSPEQMRASSTLDARSDVWSLGVILYELITGVPPFDGEAVTEVCAAILSDPPAPTLKKASNVPAGLEEIILRCLEKKPGKRFQDVGELSAALAVFGSPGSDASAARVARVLHKVAMPVVRLGSGSVLTESQRARAWNATTASVSVPSSPHVSFGGRRLGYVVAFAAVVVGFVGVTLFGRHASSRLRAAATPVASAPAVPTVVPLPDNIPPPPPLESVGAQVAVPTVARNGGDTTDTAPADSTAVVAPAVADPPPAPAAKTAAALASPRPAAAGRGVPARPRPSAKPTAQHPAPTTPPPPKVDLWEERK